jgi:quaternary ammonium compound-resistance protein SugE
MNWIILLIAGIFEIAWAIGLKYTNGFSNLISFLFTILSMIISMALLAYAVKSIPVGTAYAVWTGIGVIGTIILGIILFNEPKDPSRLFFLALIVIGIIGLQIVSKSN